MKISRSQDHIDVVGQVTRRIELTSTEMGKLVNRKVFWRRISSILDMLGLERQLDNQV